jgi:TnpA family transposase
VGRGLVAAVDGTRFVVPVRSIHARPNPKYFGRRKGATYLTMVNDQGVEVAGMVLSGTPRDSLHAIDLMYRRIFKTLHVLAYVDAESYRRAIKRMRNLQEGRHGLAKHVFHGRRGELREPYHAGMEDQLGALGLVINCITLWNTVYLDAALDKLCAEGYPVNGPTGQAPPAVTTASVRNPAVSPARIPT